MLVLVLVLVAVIVVMGVRMLGTEAAQVQAGQLLDGQAGALALLEHRRQEGLQIRADPVDQPGLAHLAQIRGPQGVVVRRGTRRQQHGGLAGAVLDGGGDQLQGFDAGEHLHLGLGGQQGAGEQQGGDEG